MEEAPHECAAVGHRPRGHDARAPKGTLVAIGNHRNEVIVGDIETGEVAVIDKSEHGRTEDLAWSPDAQVARVHFWTDARHCAIKL